MKKVLSLLLVFMLVGVLFFLDAFHPTLAAEKDKYGGIFKLNFLRPAARFGVPLNIRHSDRFYAGFSLEKLIQQSETQGVYEPLLATSWELSPDEKSYTITLRKGVKFHDGTDFNAQAVKWNLDKVLADPRPVLDNVKSIEVVDDYTIRLHLSGWDNLVLMDLLRDACNIISPTAFEKHGEKWANTHPIGTGPWKLKEFRRNTMVKYERFNDYWQKGIPYFDGVEVHQIVDPMTAIASLKRGEVHSLYGVDPMSASELKATGQYDVAYIEGLHDVLVINSTDVQSVWTDKRMREALEYAVNKEKIVKALGRGFAVPVYEIVHSCPGNPKKTLRKYDPEKAKTLMKEAGYPDGVEVNLTIRAEGPRDSWIALQENLATVGIKVNLTPVRGATLNQMSFKPLPGSDLRHEPQRGGGYWLAGAKETLSSNSIYFPGLKRPPGFTELIEETLIEKDMDKQIAAAEKAEELAYDFAMFIPLWSSPHIGVVKPVIEDHQYFFRNSPDVRLERAYFIKK